MLFDDKAEYEPSEEEDSEEEDNNRTKQDLVKKGKNKKDISDDVTEAENNKGK